MKDVEQPDCQTCRCKPQPMERRGVLARLLGIAGGMIGLSLISGCPGGSTAGKKSEATTTTGEETPQLSKLEWDVVTLPDGIAAEFKVNGKPAYLLHVVVPVEGHSEEKYIALSRQCPHAGCTVNYVYTKQKLECPCHGSVFNAQGQVIKGPAKTDLVCFSVREENGKVIVEVPGAYLGKHGVVKRRPRF